MPSIFSDNSKTNATTITMTTMSNRTDTAVTYTTSSSPHMNNSITSSSISLKQENSSSTKYIQLQTVRPQSISTGMTASVSTASTSGNNASQGATLLQQHATLQSASTGIPPGLLQ